MTRNKTLIALLAALALFASACEPESDSQQADRKLSEQILQDLQRAHPVPQFRYSQVRQNLVELITAQAQTTQTTTFFFNMGIQEPVNSCPSIGFPIPATMQLTNPEMITRWGNGNREVLPQVEPTGVYTGDTTGTYVICINAQGDAYAVYWEGFTQTLSGPAEWTGDGVDLIGPPSFEFTNEGETDAVVEEGDEDFVEDGGDVAPPEEE